ncbi:MAG: DUF89 family protein [Dehalococcoidales bacterium]|nr:DUF89 family protein [Dehalococcoidales bacterium]
MKTYLDCIPCFLRQALAAARAATDDEQVHHRVLKLVAPRIVELPLEVTPPEIAQQVYRVVAEVTGNSDPYRKEKDRANQQALALYPQAKKIVAQSDDPLLSACKLAIAGNTIDLGPSSGYADIGGIVEQALVTPFGVNDYAGFRKSLSRCRHILYLGDNAGEIVLDKILIEELRRLKDISLDFVVREKPIINDATLADARYIGLDEVTNIVSSGSDAPAIVLAQCSPEVLRLYNTADVIIAKGQGNYESLSGERRNIFFLLRAKCQLVARQLGVNVGDAILKQARGLSPGRV